ncbi:MAG: ribose 5-phosphate isomerase A [Chloroflexota bacterium]|nr:ribose 5-phosphate isomerase A [Chloroflexota bacterium]
MQDKTQQDNWKQLAGEAAARLIEQDMVIGLGTGSTATYLLHALARRIEQEGLHIVGAVPTSQVTEQLARELSIPLTTLDIHPELDLAIDGADEIDRRLCLIKGGGGALLREKIVASAAQRFVVVGDVTKQVLLLGTHFPLPIETVPFAVSPVRKRLEALGAIVQLRQKAGQVFITDNGNIIYDCSFPDGIQEAEELQTQIKKIVGVVETGLFLGMVERAIIGGPDGVKELSVRTS